MQYLLLIYEDEKRWINPSPEEAQAEMGAYIAFGKENAAAILGGNALQPTMTGKTVRVRNGQASVTDGPFAETKEQLGGYYLVEAASPEAAVAIAGKIPGAKSGCVEVRPIQTFA